MDTKLLETFREVAKQGSFSGAARRLAYTQSAVSRQVSTLEAHFGVSLFDRRVSGVQLTEHGRCLLEHAESVLARVEGITPQLLAWLEDDDADLAVVSAFPGQTIDRERFDFVPLLEDAMLVALPLSHRLARRRRHVRLAELGNQAWIGADASTDDWSLGPARLASAVEADFPVREWTAKLGLVAAGLGATLVPSLAAQAARADVALVPLDRADAPPRTVYAATLHGRTPGPAVDAFIGVLQQSAKQIAART